MKRDLYRRIREILEAARAGVARSVNTGQVVANWLIGREIVEEEQRGAHRARYGERSLADLSGRLQEGFGRGYSVDNLEWFRQFYLDYPQLLGLKKSDAVRRISGSGTFSAALRRKSESDDAWPIPLEKPAATHDAGANPSWQPGELHPNLSWTHYRTLLRVKKTAARAFYIDLVFYHTMLKCYVLLDLKIKKLTHEDLGQLQLCVHYFDQERRTPGDNPTLGLILCTDKNDAVVRYTLGPGQKNIFASRYKLHLPSEAELRAEVRRELKQLRADS